MHRETLGVEPQPDTHRMPLAISRSKPFRRLLSRIGSSTYRLNTVLVGLENIAAGAGQTGAVAVRWTKPGSTEKAKEVANQARIFACAGALVLAADVFDCFLRDFAREEWLGFTPETQAIATKARTRPSEQGGEYSLAERAAAICNEMDIVEPIKVAAMDFLAKWRNVVVHSSDRRTRISNSTRDILTEAAAHFYAKYAHLDIGLALRNFDGRKVPVPKEVTTLIAIAVNFSRQLDKSAIRRVASNSDETAETANRMLLSYFRNSDERPLSSWRELSEIWQGGANRRKNQLKKILAGIGITETLTPVSAALAETFVDELVALSRDDFAQRFGVVRG